MCVCVCVSLAVLVAVERGGGQAARVSQQALVDALSPVLDADTTAFVAALWRQLLICSSDE